MKPTIKLLTLTAVLAIAAAGCKSPTYLTKLPPGATKPTNTSLDTANQIGSGSGTSGTGGPSSNLEQVNGTTALPDDDVSNWNADHEALKQQTVYFDYDKSAIKSSEESKLQAVASYLNSHPGVKLMVEGNCDSRGTEEYNRSLGERRAGSAREALLRMGVNAELVHVKSWGEDNPANATGTGESVYSKNRRDDFVVLTKPTTPVPNP